MPPRVHHGCAIRVFATVGSRPRAAVDTNPMHRLRLAAPAKLNLYLEVIGRRSDGFHELETVFQTIGLADEVEVAVRDGSGITLACDEPGIPGDARNLAWRAAERYAAGKTPGCAIDIRLVKRIPHGAGLGGGSSDAAAVLRALAVLLPGWHDAAGLAEIAAALGSDVPFFLMGGTAWGGGRGERLVALPDLPRLPVTVLMPSATLPTPAVFAALRDDERGPRVAQGAERWGRRLQAEEPSAWMENRLTGAAVRTCPPVGMLLAWLAERRIPHLMSGSGAACFALAHLDAPSDVRAWRTWLRPRHELDAVAEYGA
jgi:4-diphosphocytidyl-2-C-methyl-D-erythritol kinase